MSRLHSEIGSPLLCKILDFLAIVVTHAAKLTDFFDSELAWLVGHRPSPTNADMHDREQRIPDPVEMKMRVVGIMVWHTIRYPQPLSTLWREKNMSVYIMEYGLGTFTS